MKLFFQPGLTQSGIYNGEPKNMARGLKFRIWEVEGLCYKGADELSGYHIADLRQCFLMTWHN